MGNEDSKNQPIRVLHLLDNLRIVGGITTCVMNLYRNIDRNLVQFDFLVVFKMEDTYYDEIISLGGRVYYLDSPSSGGLFSMISGYRKYAKSASLFFKQHASDYIIVHSHTSTLSGPVFKAAKKYGVKYRILHSHSIAYSDDGSMVKNLRNRLFVIAPKRLATHYYSGAIKSGEFLYGEKAFSQGRVTVLKNGIDIEKFRFSPEIRRKYRKELGLENNFVVGHVGRMTPIKNQGKLLEIFAALCKKKEDAVLLFIGTGPLQDQLIEEAKQMNILNRIHHLGARNDVNNLMQAMDCFVLPSLTEGVPMVGIEAQAAGLPVFFSEGVPDAAFVVNAEKIFLSQSAEAWADIILEKAGSYVRRDTADAITDGGYNITATAAQLQKFYLSL